MSPKQGGWSLRYYLCLDDQVLMRLPNSIHRKMLNGELKIQQFANTGVRVLEVFVSNEDKGKLLDVRGGVFNFGSEGELDFRKAVEAYAIAYEKIISQATDEKLVDLGPYLRDRRWRAEHTWKPTAALINRVQADITSGKSRSSKIPTIKSFLKGSLS